ncbi:MAG: GNAT family N-acetyltransferase [Magnetococcales bacterium]|nr:GNAT family N-acetyltransferase [Magnetococcales bacterium]
MNANPFLNKPWLEVMRATRSISAIEPVTIGSQTLHVGVVRTKGQTRWDLFGSFADPDGSGLEELFQVARHRGAMAVACRFNMARWPEEVVTRLGCELLEPFGTYQVDLTQDENRLWHNLHPKHRNAIRRARELGVTVTTTLHFPTFCQAMQATYQRGDRDNPFSAAYFSALEQQMQGHMLGVTAHVAGAFQAGAIIPYGTVCGFFLHGATIDAPTPGAATLLHWEIMRLLKEREVASYDLGGARPNSDDPRLQGIFRFKERFGGPFEPCRHWQRVVHPGRHLWHRLLTRMIR